ncbi:ZIP family metal transporter [Acidaminococcus fermentans]|uniref:ZIP family metal transporter n=1 Tax=Acidaminococcus fermentans TaxID=905 RepID=UPI0039F5C87E
MSADVWKGILIPFLGTSLGAGCVYFMKEQLHRNVQRGLTGFAAGVMVAASIWSLLIPALEESAGLGAWAFLPAVIGFWGGILFLLLLDELIPHLHLNSDEPEGPHTHLAKTTMLLLAVTRTNNRGGMAGGRKNPGYVTKPTEFTMGSALVLSLGIAIQNFPEGAIISLPLKAGGMGRHKAFLGGVLSGAVEPIAAAGAILASRIIGHLLPYFLSFAAGAMLYVVVEEMIPEMSEGEHSNVGVLTFALGFTVMMTLDVALG